MSTRQLVVIEAEKDHADEGRLFGINPVDLKGIALPTMEFVDALPASGGIEGQLYYVSTSHQSYTWDGKVFQQLTPSIIVNFDTDTLLLANTSLADGAYASATDSGNLYVKIATGWKQVGVHDYPTVAGLLTDTPADGSMGFAEDENSVWLRSGGAWFCQTIRSFADLATLQAWTAPDNSQAINLAENTRWYRVGGKWVCRDIRQFATEVLLKAWAGVDGSMATITADNTLWIRIKGKWVCQNTRRFANSAAMNLWAPEDGATALEVDDNSFWVRSKGNWVCQTIRAMADIATINGWIAPDGARAFDIATGTNYFRTGGAWHSSEPIVDTEAHILGMSLTPVNAGQLAISSDTGKTFILQNNAGVKSWVGSPIMHYGTELALLAASPPAGIIAFADDTGTFFGRTATAWVSSAGESQVIFIGHGQWDGTDTLVTNNWGMPTGTHPVQAPVTNDVYLDALSGERVVFTATTDTPPVISGVVQYAFRRDFEIILTGTTGNERGILKHISNKNAVYSIIIKHHTTGSIYEFELLVTEGDTLLSPKNVLAHNGHFTTFVTSISGGIRVGVNLASAVNSAQYSVIVSSETGDLSVIQICNGTEESPGSAIDYINAEHQYPSHILTKFLEEKSSSAAVPTGNAYGIEISLKERKKYTFDVTFYNNAYAFQPMFQLKNAGAISNNDVHVIWGSSVSNGGNTHSWVKSQLVDEGSGYLRLGKYTFKQGEAAKCTIIIDRRGADRVMVSIESFYIAGDSDKQHDLIQLFLTGAIANHLETGVFNELNHHTETMYNVYLS